jgi:ATP-dependent DNA helicase RecQ
LFEEEAKDTSIKLTRTLINYLDVLRVVRQSKHKHHKNLHHLQLLVDPDAALKMLEGIHQVASFIIGLTYDIWDKNPDNKTANYSIVELKSKYDASNTLFQRRTSLKEAEQALLLIHRIGALLIDGGFLVLYNPMRIQKLELNPQKQYTKQDYKEFEEYYDHKIKKIHILIHFVESLSQETQKGLSLVEDYFRLDYKEFEKRYITKEYRQYYEKAMTKSQYEHLFTALSKTQRKIIDDDKANTIVVLAGPGSGKTTLLVHKLAALIELEDVRPEELLMLTFSRSATIVFKDKLRELVGARANYVSIKTFHSYCFDVIGQVGNLEKTEHLFESAIRKIKNNDVEESLLNVSTIVIDEAQDMSAQEYDLIQAIMHHNDSQTKLIAVGDDDQNIYQFRGSDSSNLYRFTETDCNRYELLTNYRSKQNLVEFSQHFVELLDHRYKEGRLVANTDENGHIIVVTYDSADLYEPVCRQVQTMSSKDTTAVLTYSNEDAEILTGLLLDIGVNARLIQSNKGFKLHMLYEFDWLLSQLREDTKYITDKQWADLMLLFEGEFHMVTLYAQLRNILTQFEVLYPNNKYAIDLKSYLRECKLDDMFQVSGDCITVSTIHKSKGREFGNVFIMLNQQVNSEQDKRALYVAMTRAKHNLVINTNQHLFDSISVEQQISRHDPYLYQKPNRLVFQMDHSHINLSGCKYTEHAMHHVRMDSELGIDEKGLTILDRHVAYFSKAMKEEMHQRQEAGYRPVVAYVTFKVKWFSKEDQRHYWIVLPKIIFEKQKEDLDALVEE